MGNWHSYISQGVSSEIYLHLTLLGCLLKVQILGPTPAIDSLGPRNLHFSNILDILTFCILYPMSEVLGSLITKGFENWS